MNVLASVTICIDRKFALATLPHLVAAENNTTAVVQPIDNDFISSLTQIVDGGVAAALSPVRALTGAFGIHF